MSENSPARFLRPDSPWLWVGLFAIVGLSGVLIISPKYADRRERLDRQFQGRQKVMEDTSAKALQAANISPEENSESESQSSLLWFVGAIAIGSSVLTGFAFYVFRGGHLRSPHMIPAEQTADSPADTEIEDAGHIKKVDASSETISANPAKR